MDRAALLRVILEDDGSATEYQEVDGGWVEGPGLGFQHLRGLGGRWNEWLDS